MATQDHKAAVFDGQVTRVESVDRQRDLVARHQALLTACDAAFLKLRGAPAEEAAALRDGLARLHHDLSETLQRRAILRWDDTPPAALQAALADLLTRVAGPGGAVGPARISEAKTALTAGSLAPAEQIFAELAALNAGPADQTARLVFAQGLIAEAAMRWADATQHFVTAARLDPDVRSLQKARAFSCLTGDLTGAFRLGQGLMVLAETSGGPADRAMAMAEHALTLEAQDRFTEAEGFLRKAVLGARSATAGQLGADHARLLAQLARVLDAQDRFADAEVALRKAVDITRTMLGETHPDYAGRLNALAGVLRAQGRDREAEQLHLKALDLAQRLDGGPHPVMIDSLTGLALLAETSGRLPQAEQLYRQALALDLRMIGPTHPDHAGRLCALAEVLRAQRRLAEAESLFRQALEIDRATIGEAHRDFGVALNNLAGVVEAQGRATEAEALYAVALAIFRATLGDLHPATLKVTKNFRALIATHLPGSVHRPGVEALWDLGQQDLPIVSDRS